MEKSNGNYNLVIAGGMGWKTESFDDDLAKNKFKEKIICTGFVPDEDLPALYSQAISLIYPSKYEGFGLPIVEAMNCEVPVITAKNSSLPEAGGDAALYFDTFDVTMLVDRMNEITSKEFDDSSMSKASLSHANSFSWNTFATTFWNELSQLVYK